VNGDELGDHAELLAQIGVRKNGGERRLAVEGVLDEGVVVESARGEVFGGVDHQVGRREAVQAAGRARATPVRVAL
jgi:hypothetical protein